MNKGTKIVLAISFLINVFLIGLISGHFFKQMRYEPRTGFSHKRFSQKMSLEARKVFDEKLSIVRAGDKEFFAQIEAVREEAFTVLTAEKFNRELYRDKLETLKMLHSSRISEFMAAIEEAAAGMSQEDRRILAEGLRKFGERRSHSHKFPKHKNHAKTF